MFAGIPIKFIDLLRLDVRNQLLDAPDSLEAMIPPNTEWVIIDEVQKIPELLDVVHRLIEDKGIKFGLTVSSARKLKHGGANLLAGRAFVYNLFPFTSFELGESFRLEDALMWGTLPKSTRYKTRTIEFNISNLTRILIFKKRCGRLISLRI